MIYFDNSATSRYKPDCVIDAVVGSLRSAANPGRSGHAAALEAARVVEAARASVKRLCGAEKAHCIFTGGCTAALNQAIFGTVRRGHVIATVTEHNSVLRPLQRRRDIGVAVTFLAPDADGAIAPEAVLRAMRRDTVLVCVNHASNVTGRVQDLAAICAVCRRRGVTTLADGAQSAGYVPFEMDAIGLDLLALAPHKGLHAPLGVGVLLASERVRMTPLLLGGTGIDSLNPRQAPTFPEGFEAGTAPYHAIAGLGAAADWAMGQAPAWSAHALALTTQLCEGLARQGAVLYSRPNPVGVVSFNLRGSPAARVADALDARGICVRAGHHCAPLMHDALGTLATGTVRASVSVDNTAAEVDAFLRALSELG